MRFVLPSSLGKDSWLLWEWVGVCRSWKGPCPQGPGTSLPGQGVTSHPSSPAGSRGSWAGSLGVMGAGGQGAYTSHPVMGCLPRMALLRDHMALSDEGDCLSSSQAFSLVSAPVAGLLGAQ